jgi:hypothetical protein
VHTVLEREVRPEEVKVDITTNEERWGLKYIVSALSFELISGANQRDRLLNLIACFESLLGEGMTVSYPHWVLQNCPLSLAERVV